MALNSFLRHDYNSTIQQKRESYPHAKKTKRWTTSPRRYTKYQQPDIRPLYKQQQPRQHTNTCCTKYSRKNLLPKHDCSQAYHCLQKADQRSVEMIVYNCTSKIFADWRLIQSLSKSLSLFLSFICEFLDPVIKTAQGAHCVNDIGIVANSHKQLISNL